MELKPTVPTKIQSIDFEKVSELVGCTNEELIEGLHANATAVEFTGAVVEAGVNKTIAFEATTTTTATIINDDIEKNNLGTTIPDETTMLRTKPPKSHRKVPSLIIGIPSVNPTDDHLSHLHDSFTTTTNIQIVEDNKIVTEDNVFDGFLVGVKYFPSESSSSSQSSLEREDRVGLLNSDHHDIEQQQQQQTARRDRGFSIDEPLIVSIPAPPPPTTTPSLDDTATPECPDTGYLIDIPLHPGDNKTGVEVAHQSVLAIPSLPHHHDTAPVPCPPSPGCFDDNKPPTTMLERSLSFLPTTLERSLSYLPNKPLPTDVENISLAVVGKRNPHIKAVVERRVPLIGYVLLSVALVAMSSVGTALQMQKGTPALMKLYWRMTATVLLFSPMAVKSIRANGYPKVEKEDVRDLILCAICYAGSCGAFVVALDLTTVGACFLYATFHSFILVIGKVVMGMEVMFLEGMGTAVGIMGGILSALDHPMDDGGDGAGAGEGGQQLNPLLGDFFAFLSAVGAAGYLLLACKLRRKYDLFVFVCANLGVGSFVLLLFMHLVGIPYTISRDESLGIFGWTHMTPDRFPLECFIVIICNGLGTIGYVAVMKYFESLVVSVTMLVEPEIATVIGLLLGVGAVPGKWAYIGGFFVTAGALMVIISSSSKTESFDVGDAVEKVKVPPNEYNKAKEKDVGYGSTPSSNYSTKKGSIEME